MKSSLIPLGNIEHSILWIRGQKVILDYDLADIYGVTTTRLNQQVTRNIHRFPLDFSFVLTKKEFNDLMLQFATSNSQRGGRRKQPRAFTEHGAIMAASVLNTSIAVAASIHVVRAFIRMRELLMTHKEFTKKFGELEEKFLNHDDKLGEIFKALRTLMFPPVPKKKMKIGFRLEQ